MKLSQLIGQRSKEVPKDAQSTSHIFLIRGGYIRLVSSGIYTLLPIAKRMVNKISTIVREEMDKINGQEILMPLVNPAELWQESGRYDTVDQSLLRFTDRNGKNMVLAMTHEETVCHLAKTEITSYKQLPTMLYQLQTKYRDEARPRAGLIRVREFTMKDAYSFHQSQDCLSQYYEYVHKAYERIFERIGMNNFISIESDGGMIGSGLSHEFMAIAECGEDTIFVSPDYSYRANKEIARSNIAFIKKDELALEQVYTPNHKTIEEVSTFLQVNKTQIAKSVLYYSPSQERIFFIMIRGDLEINETKLKNFYKINDIIPADQKHFDTIDSIVGYASAYKLNTSKFELIIDPSVAESSNLVIGANKVNFHYKNFNYQRDLNKGKIVDIATVRAGDPCPLTGDPLQEIRGIEIGNIFQLGDKYSKSMSVNYLDQNGKAQIPIMGCYGIGIGRILSSVLEQSNDKYGPIWPLSITPWHLHIIVLNPDKESTRQKADELYQKFNKSTVEVIYDDRGVKAGYAFNDADLLGIPYRIIVSPKTLSEGKVEFKTRNGSEKELINYNEIFHLLSTRIISELEQIK